MEKATRCRTSALSLEGQDWQAAGKSVKAVNGASFCLSSNTIRDFDYFTHYICQLFDTHWQINVVIHIRSAVSWSALPLIMPYPAWLRCVTMGLCSRQPFSTRIHSKKLFSHLGKKNWQWRSGHGHFPEWRKKRYFFFLPPKQKKFTIWGKKNFSEREKLQTNLAI